MEPVDTRELYAAYAFLVAVTADQDTLDELATQALDDMRLSEVQRDALLILFEAQSSALQVHRLHRSPT